MLEIILYVIVTVGFVATLVSLASFLHEPECKTFETLLERSRRSATEKLDERRFSGDITSNGPPVTNLLEGAIRARATRP